MLTAEPSPAEPLRVAVSVSQTGDFAASGETGSKTVTVDTDGMGTLEVATRENEANESDGSITVTVVAEGDGYAVASGDATATVTVGDDDQPVISISADPATIDEGGIARFTLTAEPSPAEPLRVAVSVSQTGDFAASGETGSKTVTVDTDGMGTLEVATRENEANESDGSITVTVVAEGDGYAVASGDATATVTVGDDDQPVISISADPTNINEGGIARFTLTAEPSPAEPAPGCSVCEPDRRLRGQRRDGFENGDRRHGRHGNA